MTIKSRHATGGPMDNKNTNPGPGQYETNISSVKGKNAGGMGTSQRSNLGGKGETPGPGHFNPSSSKMSVGTSFGYNKGDNVRKKRDT